MEEQTENKRRSIRVPVDLPVTFFKQGKEYHGRILNLSTEGVFISTDHLFSEGDSVEVLFILPGSSNFEIRVTARIIWGTWIEETKAPTSGMGLEFEGMEEKQENELQKFVDQLLKK